MKHEPQYTVIRGGRVWTAVAGGTVATRDILIKGDRIEALYEPGSYEIPPNAEDIDASGKTVLPGLVNAHTHITLDGRSPDPMATAVKDGAYISLVKAIGCAKEHLAAGVTTIRDLAAMEGIDFALKKAIAEDMVIGPRMLVSGMAICITGGHGRPLALEADGADSVRRAARLQLKNGADVIKLMATGGVMTPGVEPGSAELTVDEMKAAVEEAQKAGKRTASHAQGTQGIKNAIHAGVTTIEHGVFLDNEAIQLMLARGVYLVPTLSAPYFIIKGGTEAGIPEFAVHKTKQVIEQHLKSFRAAHQAGVKIAMGTDQGTPFNVPSNIVQEIRLMVENGMSPEEALSSATRVAAEALGLGDQIGTIEPGKCADILALDGDPLSNLDSLENVTWVMKEGEIVYRG